MTALGIVVAAGSVLLVVAMVLVVFREQARDLDSGAEFWMKATEPEKPPTEADQWADITELNPDLAAVFAGILAAEDEPTLRQQSIELPRDGRTDP